MLLASLLCARAEAAPAASKRFALVIGNAGYAEPLRPLRNPVNDAHGVAERLRALDFEVDEVLNASVTQIDAARDRFEAKLRRTGGAGLFYFAGHGVQVDGINYLIPIGAQLRDERSVAREAVSASEVIEGMSSARDGINIVILDACRDNPFATRSAARGLALMNAGNGTVIGYSTSPGQTAADGDGQNGVYTGQLIAHLGDEGLTIEDILKKTSAAVRAETHGAQVPWIATSLVEDFIPRPTAAATVADLLELARSDEASGDYLGALDMVTRAEAVKEPPITALQRLEVEGIRARLGPRLASLRLQVKPPTATVQVDGNVSYSHDGKLPLNPGSHVLRVSNPEYRPLTRTLHLEPGSSQVLSLSLRPLADRRWAWGIAAVGAAALALSLTNGLIAKHHEDNLHAHCGSDNRCPNDTSYDWQSERDRGVRFGRASDAMLGVGIASVATALVVAFVPHLFFRPGADRSVANVSCSPHGCLAQARLTVP